MVMMFIKEVSNVIDILCLTHVAHQTSCLTYLFSCHVSQVIHECRLMLDAITGPTEWSFANALVMILL